MDNLNHNNATFDRIIGKLQKIRNPDPMPLLVSWTLIIHDDNREKVLAGEDKDGRPMAPVTYRPDPKAGSRLDIRSKEVAHLRLNQKASRRHDLLFGGIGPHISGLHNNLTTTEYKRLGGPPLAPRDQFSRVITNLLLGKPVQEGDGKWYAFCYWDEVVSTTGYSFLADHFNGLVLRNGRRLPPRDLRGVRPEGRQRALDALRAWALDLIRSVAA